MTTPQLRWRELQESKRHNAVSEENTRQANAEQARTNRANEGLKAQANAINRYGIETQAATSRYAADSQAQTSRYATDTNSQTSRYVANTSARTSRYSTDVKASTDRLNASINSQRLALDQLNSEVERAKTRADIQNLSARTQQAIVQADNMVKEFALKARQQNNNDAKTKADIAQGYIDSATQGYRNLASGYKDTVTSMQSMMFGPLQAVLKALDTLL